MREGGNGNGVGGIGRSKTPQYVPVRPISQYILFPPVLFRAEGCSLLSSWTWRTSDGNNRAAAAGGGRGRGGRQESLGFTPSAAKEAWNTRHTDGKSTEEESVGTGDTTRPTDNQPSTRGQGKSAWDTKQYRRKINRSHVGRGKVGGTHGSTGAKSTVETWAREKCVGHNAVSTENQTFTHGQGTSV